MSEPLALEDPQGDASWSAIVPLQDRTRWIARHILPHEPRLRAWLRRRPIAGLETDDVIQETYVVLARLASVEHIAAPLAYAHQIARSIVRRHLRRARIAPMDSMDEIDFDTIPLDEPSPEQLIDARLQMQRLTGVVEELPAKCRQTFLLRRFEGLSQREVAESLGISESTVEKHMTRALRALMEALRQTDPIGSARRAGRGSEGPRSE